MQALRDIFSIWCDFRPNKTPDVSSMATALDEKEDTVYRWWYRGRIPERAWPTLMSAASLRGKALSVIDLHAANRPPKSRRGPHKTAPKIKPKRREERVEQ